MPIRNDKVTVNGLHRVNEPALQTLDDATFLKLRKADPRRSPMVNSCP